MPSAKEKQSVFELAKVLAILGGILIIVAGLLSILSLLTRRNLPSLESLATTLGYGLLTVILGVLAIIGSRYQRSLVWNVLLIVVGVISYPFGYGFPWELGPLMAILAGIVGIIARLV